MVIEKQLRDVADGGRMTYFGIADLTAPEVQKFIADQGGKAVTGYPRAVTVGLALSNSLVDLLPEADDLVLETYKHHIYEVQAMRVEAILTQIAAELETHGFAGLPISAGPKVVDRSRLAALFSDKLAPSLAGLGWIGRNCMLITPQHGPRVIWGTVLTDAALATTGSPMAPQCGSCRACVEICPAKAYTGRMFDPAESREMRFDPMACLKYIRQREADGHAAACGLCLYVCPHGHRHRRKAATASAQ